MPISPYTPRGTKVRLTEIVHPAISVRVSIDKIYTLGDISPGYGGMNKILYGELLEITSGKTEVNIQYLEYAAAPDVFEEILRSVKIPAVPKAAPVRERIE